MSLADVPLEQRCLAALVVIWEDTSLTIRDRFDVVAAALWPRNTIPDGDEDEDLVDEPVERWSTLDERDDARRRFRAGDTVSEIAESLDVPWRVVNEWCRSRG